MKIYRLASRRFIWGCFWRSTRGVPCEFEN